MDIIYMLLKLNVVY